MKLLGSSEAFEAFLRRGLTTADLKVDGKVPDDKEKLMMFLRVGSRSSVNGRRSDVGRGSNKQEVGLISRLLFSIQLQLSGEMNENWSQPVGQSV